MKTASQLVWESACFPSPTRGKSSYGLQRCAICGGVDVSPIELSDACPKASFSGFPDMQWPSSRWCCRACAWVMAGKPPNTLRMWTIIYRGDKRAERPVENAPICGNQVCLTNKGNFDEVGHVLIDPPKSYWSVSVADSGKLHVLPYTRLNYGNGRWSIRMDRETIYGDSDLFGRRLYHLASLISAGFSRGSVLSRTPKQSELIKIGIDEWKRHIGGQKLPPIGGNSIEKLAAMVARKESAHEWAERTRKFSIYR